MLPSSFQYIEDSQAQQDSSIELYPSLTYQIDLDSKRVIGLFDGIDAIRQAVYKILFTDRYSDIIYNDKYGCDLYILKGEDVDYAKLLTPSYIRRCLTQDDRISGVRDILIEKVNIDSLHVSFTVETIFGDYLQEMEVLVNG